MSKIINIFKKLPITMKGVLVAGIFTVFGAFIPSIIPVLFSGKTDSKIEFVDVSFLKSEDDIYPNLEIKIRNIGDRVAVIKRVDFQVEKIWQLKRNFIPLSHMISTETYDVTFPLNPTPYIFGRPISQSVEPDGSDDFTFKLGSSDDLQTDNIYLINIELFYNVTKEPAVFKNILFVTNRFQDYSNYHSTDTKTINNGFSKECVKYNKEVVEEVNKLEGLKSDKLKNLIKEISSIEIEEK